MIKVTEGTGGQRGLRGKSSEKKARDLADWEPAVTSAARLDFSRS